MPLALSISLQFPLPSCRKFSSAPAGCNRFGCILFQVVPLCTAMSSACMPAKAMPGEAALQYIVVSVCPTRACQVVEISRSLVILKSKAVCQHTC
jgi:hypothetical protein